MKLLRTGAFLRAARNARLAPTTITARRTHPTPVSHYACPSSNRWLSQSVAPNPTPSTSAAPQEQHDIDQLKQSSTPTPPSTESYPSPSDPLQSKILNEGKSAVVLGQYFDFDATSNVTETILNLTGRKLYDTPNHPLHITRKLIESVFNYPEFKNHIASNPVVTTKDNFDVLGFPADHPGRSRTDTYYVDSTHVLRTHSSAHQHAAFQYMKTHPEKGYTICADVYRRDAIDRTHFPVFHQMEGARLWSLDENDPLKPWTRLARMERRQRRMKRDLASLPRHNLEVDDSIGSHNFSTNPVQPVHDTTDTELIVAHLKRSLESLFHTIYETARASSPHLHQQPLKVRWVEAYFPFTSPSFELEVFWQGEWLEVLGCGVVKQTILNNAGLPDSVGWAWGLGLERIAMLLFNIPDIRLFWSNDPRFLSQFHDGQIKPFVPYSKYPPAPRDISFYINRAPSAGAPLSSRLGASGAATAAGGDATKASPADNQPAAFHENDIMEIVRSVCGDLVENVSLIDEFVNKKTARKSLTYRIVYRSNDRTLTGEEVQKMHLEVQRRMEELPIELR